MADPHKEVIITALDRLTKDANAIGAVDMVISQMADTKDLLFGENTDWLAICNKSSIDPMISIYLLNLAHISPC